jgi:succinoglycan biosynthesis protein ExoA
MWLWTGRIGLMESQERPRMDSSNPLVSIVVPCRNEIDHIETTVDSILAQDPPIGGFELIVADGMSEDGTRDILLRLANSEPRLRLIDNPGAIVSTGLNSAIREARGEIIIRMDSHTTYAPDYIKQCVEVLYETKADNVGGPWIARGRGIMGKAIAAAFQSPFACGGARGHDPHYSGLVDTVYLGCWQREIFNRIGFFDEELVRNQDDELNLRLSRCGGKIWQSARIKSWYEPRPSLITLFRQYVQYGYWKVRVIQKHKIPASLRHLVPGCFVFLLVALPLAALLVTCAIWIWFGLLAIYTLCDVITSFIVAAKKDYSLFPLLIVSFACMHIAYGYGFLLGLWDFLIRRKSPARRFTFLTRSTSQLPQKKQTG